MRNPFGEAFRDETFWKTVNFLSHVVWLALTDTVESVKRIWKRKTYNLMFVFEMECEFNVCN